MADFEIIDNTGQTKAELEQKLAKALELVGMKCENYAKIDCPVDTGNLRNSITHEVGKNEVVIGTPVEYAPYVEMGTIYTHAQPYLKPALENHLDEYKKIIESALKG